MAGTDALPLEWLVDQTLPNESAPPGSDHVLVQVRRLTAAEMDESHRATAFLYQLTLGSALQDLRQDSETLFRAIDACKLRPYHDALAPGFGMEVEGAFKAWLSALSSYADRTLHWLSTEFGGESSLEVGSFKCWLSNEFDTNFGYRLCCALRNASQHQGRVVNGIRFAANELESGHVEGRVYVELKCPALADRFTQMRSATRREMRTCTSPVALDLVVSAGIQSCQRVHAKLFLLLENHIDSAAKVVESYDAEVKGRALFEKTGFFDMQGSAPRQFEWKFRPNASELASAARNGLVVAKNVVPELPGFVHVKWSDLVETR